MPFLLSTRLNVSFMFVLIAGKRFTAPLSGGREEKVQAEEIGPESELLLHGRQMSWLVSMGSAVRSI